MKGECIFSILEGEHEILNKQDLRGKATKIKGYNIFVLYMKFSIPWPRGGGDLVFQAGYHPCNGTFKNTP